MRHLHAVGHFTGDMSEYMGAKRGWSLHHLFWLGHNLGDESDDHGDDEKKIVFLTFQCHDVNVHMNVHVT